MQKYTTIFLFKFLSNFQRIILATIIKNMKMKITIAL